MAARPFRRDLALLAALLPLGVVAQAVLGGYTVENKLAPGFVMAHFGLSMIILIAAVALVWRAATGRSPDPSRPTAPRYGRSRAAAAGRDRRVRGHRDDCLRAAPGGAVGQVIKRLHFEGADTLNWMVHAHGALAFASAWPPWPSGSCSGGARRDAELRARGDVPMRSDRRPGDRRDGPVRDASAVRAGLGARRAGDVHLALRAVERRGCGADRTARAQERQFGARRGRAGDNHPWHPLALRAYWPTSGLYLPI